MTSVQPWLVIGQGAIGSLMATQLARHKFPVQLKLRGASNPAETSTLSCADQQLSFATTTKLTEPCWIFAAVKAYDVEPLIHELKQSPAFQGSTLVVSYNGMLTNENQLLRSQDLHWVTTHGAYREDDRVVHAGHGQSWIGAQQPGMTQPTALIEQLAQALPPLDWEHDIASRRWHKLAVNCLINPFTVLHRCRNGEILAHVKEEQWQQIADEIIALASYRGVQLSREAILGHARQVTMATAANRSSMLQDFLHGRKMEISFLNGFIASASAEAGLGAPANQQLVEQVLTLSRAQGLR